MRNRLCSAFLIFGIISVFGTVYAQNLERLKKTAVDEVEKRRVFTQQMVDMIYSFSELGFQEFETSNYLVSLLKDNGFKVEEGAAGIPTAWFARWGSGKPVIAIGSDIDCLPKASQKPGVAYFDPIVPGAPGHGEGHNSGQAVNITAAIVVKEIMQKENIPGTIVVWPGIAEELVGTKAYYVRDGYFKGVDVCFFSHVSSNFGVMYGPAAGSGLISVEYTFYGEAAHAAAAPWRGKSALDAVELMDIGWNYRREHLPLTQRSHYVITSGGDQPNVVPSKASVWYYFREIAYQDIINLFNLGSRIADAAAMMTDTRVEHRVLGSAWPGYFNKTIAETMYENITVVGLPEWSAEDQTLAKALQGEIGVRPEGLANKIDELPKPLDQPTSGGSDDIGDVSWNVPTVTLRYPANIPNLPGHNWTDGVAEATPIAHKGCTAGAKVMAMTMLDFLIRPELVKEAQNYFETVQKKNITYTPLISPTDTPATFLNRETMERFRPELKKYYYDPKKYKTYLEQLGITYPTVRKK